MVNDNVASVGGNGLKDWILQRVTAIYFAAYSIFFFAYLCMHPQLQYETWQALFHGVGFKVASILALFVLSLHAWLGIWTVTTDYLKCLVLRLSLQTIIMIGLLGQFIWGFLIVWGQ